MNIYSLTVRAAKTIPNRFLLTRITIERIKQLEKGSKPKIDVEEKTSFEEIALREIAEGKIELVTVDKKD